MEAFLKLSSGDLSKLAELQRIEELKGKLGNPPVPLFKEVRELILRKCVPGKEKHIRSIFEKQPFGELERLITQKLLDVVAYFGEIGRLFGMKTAGCSGKSATPGSGAGLRYSLAQFIIAFNHLLLISFRSRSPGTHGITSHLDFVGVVQQPVADGIGQGRVADVGMPVFDGALAGDDGCSCLVAVLDYLQQVSPFAV